ncbi:folylpolyglutamate synthase/dihydrofolate synthase family protein [Ascidiimonas aurantiaca]|uniref:bifunctional folylpolyglutamate synthase/dihydrofolate synthase n=1 Tax=Ascidiimonas aurantiaca TaxID=1685432 RepID=UPI0030ECBA1E
MHNRYEKTLAWMYKQLPMFQKQGNIALNNKLDNSLHFCEYLGNPEKTFKMIHVAGTNGKGSVSHIMASVLQEAGYRTGLFSSPHLKDFRERIKINGKEVPENYVVNFVEKNKSFLESHHFSFFEMTTVMAFAYFAHTRVDIAVIETGLGGRLDSTNVITPELSVITNIGFDHMDILGATLPKIAFEKAGIIKPGVPVVLGEYHPETWPVFKEKAAGEKAPLLQAASVPDQPYETDLKGAYQKTNIHTAVTALKALPGFTISEASIERGLLRVAANTGLKGRWQQLGTNPLIICDVAHNANGFEVIVEQIKAQKYKKLYMVLGMVKEKDLNTILPLFPKEAIYYFCKPDIARGLDATLLKEKASEYDLLGEVFGSVTAAYNQALKNAQKDDFIYVGGSTFTVAEII